MDGLHQVLLCGTGEKCLVFLVSQLLMRKTIVTFDSVYYLSRPVELQREPMQSYGRFGRDEPLDLA
jgi:hypothetical protein